MNITVTAYDILYLHACSKKYREPHAPTSPLIASTVLLIQETYDHLTDEDTDEDTDQIIAVTREQWLTLLAWIAESIEETRQIGLRNPDLLALQEELASYELASYVEDAVGHPSENEADSAFTLQVPA